MKSMAMNSKTPVHPLPPRSDQSDRRSLAGPVGPMQKLFSGMIRRILQIHAAKYTCISRLLGLLSKMRRKEEVCCYGGLIRCIDVRSD
jgi:hypothetical protein